MNLKFFFIIICIIIIHSFAFYLIKDHGLIVDEYAHAAQVQRFVQGDWRLAPGLSMIPGYHAVLSLPAMLVGRSDGIFLRYPAWILNMLSIVIFSQVARHIDPKKQMIKTLQYAFFPLIFLFFPLVYTDIFASVFLVLAALFYFTGSTIVSGLTSIIGLLVRQSNILWLTFFHVLTMLELRKKKNSRLGELLLHSIPFGVGYALFAGFVLINQGLVTGGKQFFGTSFTNIGNIGFFLFVFVLLFCPVIITRIWAGRKEKKDKKWLFLFLCLFVLFFFTFTNTHPWNEPQFFLRNKILAMISDSFWIKGVYAAMAAGGAIVLWYMPLLRKELKLLYPFALLSLLPIGFVEQRYYVPIFVLLLLFRKIEKPWVEYLQAGYFVGLSLFFYWGVWAWKFFL